MENLQPVNKLFHFYFDRLKNILRFATTFVNDK